MSTHPDLARTTATQLVAGLRKKSVSAVELAEASIARIEALDGQINAVIVRDFKRALADARAADEAIARGETRPLLGVPMTVKESYDLRDHPTTWGVEAHREHRAHQDALSVQRLKQAGAVVLGKTNVPELTITPFTESPAFGYTRNPWDLQRTSGGSSGGSATAVAAGLCSAAIGSDGAGSIRIPAAACGLFGLKAQRGRVPTAPHADPWTGLAIWGPISRRVADSARIYDAIRDGGGSFAAAAAREPGRLRIVVAPDAPRLSGVTPDAEQLGAVSGTATLLRELGHDVADGAVDWAEGPLLNTVVRYLRGIHEGGRALPHPERLSRRAKRYVRIGGAIPAALADRAKAAAAADAERLNSVFAAGADVVVTPMFTRRPPHVGRYEGRGALWTLAADMRLVPWCGPYNHTGQPAAAVPAGFAGDGFPLSVQLVAPPEREDVLLSLAAQLERARGWADHRPAGAAP